MPPDVSELCLKACSQERSAVEKRLKLYLKVALVAAAQNDSDFLKAPFTRYKKVYSKMPGQNARTTFYAVFHTILIMCLLFYGVQNQLSWHSVRAFLNRLLCSVNGALAVEVFHEKIQRQFTLYFYLL